MKSEWLLTAILFSSFGLDGTIKAYFFSGSSLHLKCEDSVKVVLKNTNEVLFLTIDGIRQSKSDKALSYLHFKNFTSKESVKKLGSAEVYVKREKAHKLNKNEVYIADLLDLDVICNDKKIGKVVGILDGTQSILLQVQRDEKKYLVPYLSVFLEDPNLDSNTIELKKGELVDL